MSTPNMFDLPGAGAMNDTLEFVKNMWGGTKVPGIMMPSISVDDINKQIADLKAVESWLTLNMNMLRGTIHTLEVQSATLAALQSMSETMTAAMPNLSAKPASAPQKKPAAEATRAFEAHFNFAAPTADKPPAPQAEASAATGVSPAFDVPEAMPPFADAAAWWNTLQSQFNQAVSGAMTPEPAQPKPASKPKSAVTRKSVPKSKTAPKSASKSGAKKTASARKRTPASKK